METKWMSYQTRWNISLNHLEFSLNCLIITSVLSYQILFLNIILAKNSIFDDLNLTDAYVNTLKQTNKRVCVRERWQKRNQTDAKVSAVLKQTRASLNLSSIFMTHLYLSSKVAFPLLWHQSELTHTVSHIAAYVYWESLGDRFTPCSVSSLC